MVTEPSVMRCLGQAAGEIIRAVKTPVEAPGAEVTQLVSQRSAEARVGDHLLRRTVTDEIVTAPQSASNSSPCA